MSSVSEFTELVARFRLLGAQLTVAVQASDRTSLHAALLNRTADVLNEIERYEPKSRAEREEMLSFFARRQIEEPHARPLVNIVSRVAGTATEGAPKLSGEGPRFRLRPMPDTLPDPIEAEDLARLVTWSSDRVAAIGPRHRILAVSSKVAKAWHMPPEALMGKHFLEVTGCGHGPVREKLRLDAALAGEPQEYRADWAGIDRRRRIIPARDRNARTYAAVIVTESG